MALNIDLSKTQAYLDWFKQLLYYNWKANNSKNKNIRVVKRGQVYYCDLGLGVGSEETKNRPCVIIQNNTGNNFSPNTIVAPITNEKAEEKVSVAITGTYTYNDIEDGIQKNLSGYILLANIVTVSKARLGQYIGELNCELKEMDEKILTSLGLYENFKILQEKVTKDKTFIKNSIDENYRLRKSLKEIIDSKDFEKAQEILKKYKIEKMVD